MISFKFILAHYGNFVIASYGISFRLVYFQNLLSWDYVKVLYHFACNFMANKGRMKDIIKAVIMSIGVIFIVCMIAVFTIGHHMVGLFTTDQDIVEMATFILRNNDIIVIKWCRFLVLVCFKPIKVAELQL